MGLLTYVSKRAILSVLVIFGTISITFFLSRVVPSNPAVLWVGQHPTYEEIERARKMLGLDKPLYVQYFSYLTNFLRGDLGESVRLKSNVLSDILFRLPATLELVMVSFIIAIALGIPLGVISAVKENKLVDHLTRTVSIAGASIPVFWLGIVFQIFFFGMLGILPLNGRISPEITLEHPITRITGFYLIDSLATGNWLAFKDAFIHLILPAITIAAYPLGLCTRMVRASMIEVLRENYIRAARASGIPERTIVYRFALKNSIIPALTALGLSFAYSITGAFLVEFIFGWGGIGSYLTAALSSIDYPVIVGVTIFVCVFYVVINLILDVFQAVVDPRVRY
jgi:peptide/nickel transport system permease protein